MNDNQQSALINALKLQISLLLEKKIHIVQELDVLRSEILGKSGIINVALQDTTSLDPSLRKSQCKEINIIKNWAIQELFNIEKALKQEQIDNLCQTDDHTLNLLTNHFAGSLHPLKSLICEISEFFDILGFVKFDGSEILTAHNNFDALNTDKYHPSRKTSDTFYLNNTHVLRTHTTGSLESNMRSLKPPFKSYCIGPVYRNEDEDSTHTCMFHQLDLVVMSEKYQQFSVSDLKGLVDLFIHGILGKTDWTWQPDYFPFTEPSFGAYIGDLELLGCGLLHPKILKEQGFENHSCLAIGIGLERILSIKQKFTDIRDLYGFDARKR